MLVGLLTVTIHLQGIDSLKGKRKIVKSVVERLRNRFNVSAAEIAAQDSKQLAVAGIAVVSNDGSHVDEQLDKIVNFIVNDGRFYVVRIHRETFTSDDDIILQ
jgi:uncharacterized protein YlxP (DUF503 family)